MNRCFTKENVQKSMNTRKDVQHHYLLEICKLEPQDTDLLECLKLKRPTTLSVGVAVE